MRLAGGIVTVVIGAALLVWFLVAGPFGDANFIAIVVACIAIIGGAVRIFEAVTGRESPIKVGPGQGPDGGPGTNPYDGGL
jgi:hypothetical protein